jgi:hypothetical protein
MGTATCIEAEPRFKSTLASTSIFHVPRVIRKHICGRTIITAQAEEFKNSSLLNLERWSVVKTYGGSIDLK